MKLTLILMVMCILQVNASTYAQNVNINVKGASLKEVFEILKTQSNYEFIYDSEMLKSTKSVSLTKNNVPINEVLDLCFLDQPVDYLIKNRTIIVVRKDQPDLPAKILVKGVIKDEKGGALPGVTVKIKGTQAAVSAQDDGTYTIQVPDEKTVLVFSFIGYTPQEILVGNNSVINITLKEQNSKLNEIVVVGYGTVKKGDITGSVGTVKVQEMDKAPVGSFEESLAGRVAGVQVRSPEGQPGEASSIVIRGNNSVTQDNSPLYVIDGFPIENPTNNALNPAEIESITVLKDASATAIYGARGANGVIVITTKKGKVGAPVITYDGYAGVQNNLKQMQMMSPYEYVKYQLELVPAWAIPTYTPAGTTLEDYKTQSGTNWQDQIYRTAPIQSHNLSVRGGNDNTQYSVSGSYFGQDGIILNSGFDRYQGRITLDQKVNDKLTLNFNTNYTSSVAYGTSPSQNMNSSSANLLYSVWGFRPVDGVGAADLSGLAYDPSVFGYNYNPVLEAENALVQNTTTTLIANGALNYKLFKDLTLRISGGINQQRTKNVQFYNSHTREGDISAYSPSSFLGINGSILQGAVNNYLNENTLTWNKLLDKNNTINIVAGYTIQSYNVSNYGFSGSQLPNESLGISGLDEGTTSGTVANSSNNFLASYLGRINYSYKDRYLLTASFRSDGSSKFAPGNKWSYFPSGALAWRISSEPFMKKLSFISDAKLRTSYGITGNNRVSDFAYLSTVSFPIGVNYSFNNAYVTGNIPSLGNTDLKWETTAQSDGGLDISFLKNRLNLVVDYYDKITSNLLLNAQLPPTTGYATGFKNIGKVSNNGWEFELNTINVQTHNFSWATDFNISFNRNKVLALTQNQQSIQTSVAWDTNYLTLYPYIAEIGQPIGMFYGYKWVGNYQYSDFNKLPNGTYVLKGTVPDNGSGRTVVQPGDIKYADLNGDGTVNAADRTVIGNPNPKSTGGFSNTFTYKGFDLNVFLQWSYGNDILNANRLVFEGGGAFKGLNSFATYEDRWTPTNQNNIYYRTGGYGLPSYSSRVIEDGSFLRVKTVSLGYKLPTNWIKGAGFRSARVYVSAQNLATLTGYSGSDPEVSTRNSALTPGFDYSAYPRARTLVFGVTFSL